MKIFNVLVFALLSTFAMNNVATAQYNVADEKTIVDIAVGSDAHTTLVAALQAAGLVEALQADGPFTVFAPDNAAFAALPEGTVAALLQPENKAQLADILTYHVVAGSFDAAAVVKAIQDNDGMVSLEALNGDMITAYLKDGSVYLKDEKGGTAKVTATDLKGSNGIIHVIEAVIMPTGK